MKKNLKLSVLLLLAVLSAPGCASIVSRSNYPVMLDSAPADAQVRVTDRYNRVYATGKTPVTVHLKSYRGFFQRADYLVTFKKPGYRDITIPLNSTIDGWYFGNILLPIGGWLGLIIIDPATGAMWRLDTDYIHADLVPDERSGLTILGIDEVPEELKERLVPINIRADNRE